MKFNEFLRLVEKEVDQAITPLIPEISEEINSGKKLRPTTIYAMSKLLNSKINKKLISAASAIELSHLASLIHDDILDQSKYRRGKASVVAKYGLNKAILIGDMLIINAFKYAAKTQNLSFILNLSETATSMIAGELEQINNEKKLAVSIDQYKRTISQKTATAFSLCAKAALSFTSQTEEKITENQVIQIGENIGIAYQMIDDIADYVLTEIELGKPPYSDANEGKLTLPFIIALQDKKTRLRIRKSNFNSGVIISSVLNKKVIKESIQLLHEHINKSLSEIDELNIPSDRKKAIKEIYKKIQKKLEGKLCKI